MIRNVLRVCTRASAPMSGWPSRSTAIAIGAACSGAMRTTTMLPASGNAPSSSRSDGSRTISPVTLGNESEELLDRGVRHPAMNRRRRPQPRTTARTRRRCSTSHRSPSRDRSPRPRAPSSVVEVDDVGGARRRPRGVVRSADARRVAAAAWRELNTNAASRGTSSRGASTLCCDRLTAITPSGEAPRLVNAAVGADRRSTVEKLIVRRWRAPRR